MAIREVLKMGDPRLLAVAQPVAEFGTPGLENLLTDMRETMRNLNGAGLAAPQIGVGLRVVIFGFEENPRYPDADPVPYTVLINPELTEISDEMTVSDEGCLSVPEIYERVERHARVRVRALDQSGSSREFDADGLLAIAVQHEMDHLLGKVFVEYLSPLKRTRIKTRMLKKTREEARA